MLDLNFLFTLLIANTITLFVSIALIGRVLSAIVKRILKRMTQEKIGTLAKQLSDYLGIPQEWAQALITTMLQVYMPKLQNKQTEQEQKKPVNIWG